MRTSATSSPVRRRGAAQDNHRGLWQEAENERWGSFAELNAWLTVRCPQAWAAASHPNHPSMSIATAQANKAKITSRERTRKRGYGSVDLIETKGGHRSVLSVGHLILIHGRGGHPLGLVALVNFQSAEVIGFQPAPTRWSFNASASFSTIEGRLQIRENLFDQVRMPVPLARSGLGHGVT